MKNIAMVSGALLIIIGIVAYVTTPVEVLNEPDGEVITKQRSWTALIPAIIGLPIFLCGLWVTVKPAASNIALQIVATLSLLGALASTVRLVTLLVDFIRAEGDFNQRSFAFLFLTGVLCWMLVLFCVMVFLKHRKSRVSGEG